MNRIPLLLLVVGAASSIASAQIAGMTDPTGQPLLDRLFDQSGVDVSAVRANSLVFVGQTVGGAQSGLLGSLVIHGAAGTSQTLGAGVVLSSGLVTSIPTTNTTPAWSNVTNTGGNNYFRDFPAQTGTTRHSGRLQERDENEISFDLDVPEGIVGVQADFVYASEEFPEWSGTGYADGFAFFVDDVNYARLPDGRPVSLLRQDDNVHFMTNGDAYDAGVPHVLDLEFDGATRILELTAPLVPGQRQHVTIVVADTGDEIYDSAVFLSRLRFIAGTTPPSDDDCHVRVRHRSGEDDSFVEFPVPGAPCDPDVNADGSIDQGDIDYLIDVIGGGANPGGANPDFNADGSADQGDVDALINVVAGGACP